MELLSGNSSLDISGTLQSFNSANQQKYIASEDIIAECQSITSTPNPEEVIIEKVAFVQKNIIVKEKLILPAQGIVHNYSPRDIRASSTYVSSDSSHLNEATTDEMELGSQNSTGSKMELCSQESIDLKMEISSQESASSKMDALSQDNSCQLYDRDENTENCFKNNERIQTGLKRKFPTFYGEQFLCKSLSKTQKASLFLRKKVIAKRKAAIQPHELLVKNLEDKLPKSCEKSPSKRKKKFK